MNKQEIGKFNISQDEDSASNNSNDDFNYPEYPAKKLSIKGLVLLFLYMRGRVSLIMHRYRHRNAISLRQGQLRIS